MKKDGFEVVLYRLFSQFKDMTMISTKNEERQQTPLGKTGFSDKQGMDGGLVSVTHHWIQGVAIVRDIEDFVRFLTRYKKSAAGVVWNWGVPYCKGRTWANHAVAANGVRFAFAELDGGFWDCWFSVPGSACEAMGVREQAEKITGLVDKYKAGFTRVDCKVRLSNEVAPIEKFVEAHDKKDFKIAQNQGGVNYSFKPSGEKSYTVYFGSRQSEAMTRVYDPEVLHGVKNATDIEVELKDGKAKEYAKLLTDIWNSGDRPGLPDDELAKFIASVAVGHVDFIDQTTATRRTNCKRWDWWQALLDHLNAFPIRLIAERAVKSFERFWGWCRRSVFRTAAAYAVAVNDMDYVIEQIKREMIAASNKLSKEHYALIDTYRFTQIHEILS